MTILTITGPTCAGKTTLEAELQRLGCGRAISHTTRAPRKGEVDGTHYHFVSHEEFNRMQDGGQFVETIQFGTEHYALSAHSLNQAQALSRFVIIVVEPIGASQITSFCIDKGYTYGSIWVDCGAVVQARRWVERLTSDMLVGKDVIEAYSERLAIMLGVESRWRKDVGIGSAQYDLELSSVNTTPGEMATKVFDTFVE